LSYVHSWSKTFETYEFYIHDVAPTGVLEVCPVHTPYCFRAVAPFAMRPAGHISLLDPLNIPLIMPGTKQRLLGISIESLLDNGVQSGYIVYDDSIKLIADGAEIFNRSIIHSGRDWMLNKWSLDEDFSAVNLLDIDLHMDVDAGVGYCTLHNQKIKLEGEYYTDVPPATATVRITLTNRDTGGLVGGAYIALMTGAQVVASGYTDGGEVTFNNVDEGSYTVKILAGGYYYLEESIEVVAPEVWYQLQITPESSPPIPWYYWLVGGVVAVGGIVIVSGMLKKKERAPIYVVK